MPPEQAPPTSRRVSRAIAARRGELNLTLLQLSTRLSTLGHSLSIDQLSRLENGHRRVTLDDLVPLAIALEVTPSFLLAGGFGDVGTVMVTEALPATAGDFALWLTGLEPMLIWTDEVSGLRLHVNWVTRVWPFLTPKEAMSLLFTYSPKLREQVVHLDLNPRRSSPPPAGDTSTSDPVPSA